MAAVDQDRIARSFLRALGAPDTPAMRAAVKAWLRKEGVSSVKRNNPWNLHAGAPCLAASRVCPIRPGTGLPGQVAVAYAGPGDKNVAVFATLDDGVRANANNLIRLQNSGYGYDRVIREARAGDAVGFLHALALSSWSAGRYGIRGGGRNNLVVIYNSMTGANADVYGYKAFGVRIPGKPGGAKRPQPGGQPFGGGSGDSGGSDPTRSSDETMYRNLMTIEMLGGWDNIVKFPVGHKLTAEDIDTIMSKLQGAGYFNDDPFGIAERLTRRTLEAHIGDAWDKSLQDTLQQEFLNDAEQAVPQFGALGEAALFIAQLSDPAKWAKFLALGFGIALTAYGGINIYRATA